MKNYLALLIVSLISTAHAQDKKICVHKIMPIYKTKTKAEGTLTFEGQNLKATKSGDLVVYAEKKPLVVKKLMDESEIKAQFCAAKAPKGNASFFVEKWSESRAQRVHKLGTEVQAPVINSINVWVGTILSDSKTCLEGFEGDGELILSCE